MKKISIKLLLIVIPCILTIFAACNPKPDCFSYISDLRKDVFVAEDETFGVVVWAGARETPYAADGIKNETRLNITVKVTTKKEIGDKITAVIAYGDNEYTQDLAFHPVKSAMACSFDVNVLPEKQVVVKLIYGDQTCTLTALSALNEDTIPYTEALKRATDYCAEYITNHTENGKLKAEISVRLLTENGNNYYYVGFTATDGEKKAVLIDGETGSVLAEKNN